MPVLLASLSLSACAAWREMPLERKDVAQFEVTERMKAGRQQLEIAGLAFHSAMAVDRIEWRTEHDVLSVLVILVPTRPELSGSFDFVIDVPDSVNSVAFGDNRVEIWQRGSPY
jgi:hypothetical protein